MFKRATQKLIGNNRGSGIAAIWMTVGLMMFLLLYVGRAVGLVTLTQQRIKVTEAVEISVEAATTAINRDITKESGLENLKRLSRGYLLDRYADMEEIDLDDENVIRLDKKEAMEVFNRTLAKNLYMGSISNITKEKTEGGKGATLYLIYVTPHGKETQSDNREYEIDAYRNGNRVWNKTKRVNGVYSDTGVIHTVEKEVLGEKYKLNLGADRNLVETIKNNETVIAVLLDYPINAFFYNTTINVYDIGTAKIIRKHEEVWD